MSPSITLNQITKIEGHARLELGIENGTVTKCELSAIEGSRYFEGLVVGRNYAEASEITSRICGICSCAHVIGAITAVEDALGFVPSAQTVRLRELLMLGERIRSHATHLYFLALPDYVGYESALAMAAKFKPQILEALTLMRIGNKVIKIIGGRDLHPVSATVGGWLKLPTQEQLSELAKDLASVKHEAHNTAELFAALKYADFNTNAECFSLCNSKNYALLSGTFTSQKSSFEKARYRQFLTEYHEPRSTANFVVKEGRHYLVGALARMNNNSRYLCKDARALLKKSKIKFPCANPFYNNFAQGLELVHCVDAAIEICKTLSIKPEPVIRPNVRAGVGIAAIEVPRGTLWHEYTLDQNGMITNANIITPTAQNLLNMQEDIRDYLPQLVRKNRERIIMEIEKLIRSYDPCFSCSAHFLEVKWV